MLGNAGRPGDAIENLARQDGVGLRRPGRGDWRRALAAGRRPPVAPASVCGAPERSAPAEATERS